MTRPLFSLSVAVLLATGCDGVDLPRIDLDPVSECATFAELVDETTGEVDYQVEENDDCRVQNTPNGVTYSRILDPMTRAGDACNAASEQFYEVKGLSADELNVAAFDEDGPGRVTASNPLGVSEGDWVYVSYWDHDGQGATAYGTWELGFQWGVPGSAFAMSDCWSPRGEPVDPVTGAARNED